MFILYYFSSANKRLLRWLRGKRRCCKILGAAHKPTHIFVTFSFFLMKKLDWKTLSYLRNEGYKFQIYLVFLFFYLPFQCFIRWVGGRVASVADSESADNSTFILVVFTLGGRVVIVSVYKTEGRRFESRKGRIWIQLPFHQWAIN
jgi:hypothetical protein